MFWWIAPLLRSPATTVPRRARVVAVIPARDEEDVIGTAIRSLRNQKFEGELRIVVLDDDSSDRTADVARRHGAEVISAEPLPPGWTGKLWTVHRGGEVAKSWNPDYL